MVGQTIDCPTCGEKTRLVVAGHKATEILPRPALVPAAKNVDMSQFKTQSSGCGGCLVLIFALFGVAGIIGSCDHSNNSNYSARANHDAGVRHWEDTLRNEDRRLNGTKTETDEEIHRDAEMLQHEQDEGITPAGMMQRELEGKHNQ
jgi:hypothetical protein